MDGFSRFFTRTGYEMTPLQIHTVVLCGYRCKVKKGAHTSLKGPPAGQVASAMTTPLQRGACVDLMRMHCKLYVCMAANIDC